jgi:hypothetical protein
LSKLSDVQSSENIFPCSWVPDICTVKWYSWVECAQLVVGCVCPPQNVVTCPIHGFVPSSHLHYFI